MVSTAERDHSHCLLILELIAHLERRLNATTFEQFARDRDESDLTAFRLAAIGETTNKLSADFKARWPEIRWAAMYRMRNLINHEYDRIDVERVWETARDDLGGLAEACRSVMP